MALLARTTSFPNSSGSSPLDELGYVETQPDDDLVRPSNFCEFIYGITPSIAAAIQETCRLAEWLAQFEGQLESSIPDDLLEACEALGDKLLSWTLESEPVVSIAADDKLMLTIFNHHANAWHRAALIYYHRRIQRTHSTDLAHEVLRVAEHMQAVEEVKVQSHRNIEGILAPITWPAFVASCEAIDGARETWREWWEGAEHYKIANLRNQWNIIQRIWNAMDQMGETGSGGVDWIDVYVRLGCHVLPV